MGSRKASGAFRCIYCNEKLTAHLIDLHVCPPVDMATELSNNDQRDNEICIEFADDVFDHEEEVQFTTEQERRINDLQFQDDDNGRRKNGKAIWSPEYCAAMLDVMENLFNDEARDTRLMRKNALYPLVAQRINQAISTKFTGAQVKYKWEKLMTAYKKAEDINDRQTGASRATCAYYDRLRNISQLRNEAKASYVVAGGIKFKEPIQQPGTSTGKKVCHGKATSAKPTAKPPSEKEIVGSTSASASDLAPAPSFESSSPCDEDEENIGYISSLTDNSTAPTSECDKENGGSTSTLAENATAGGGQEKQAGNVGGRSKGKKSTITREKLHALNTKEPTSQERYLQLLVKKESQIDENLKLKGKFIEVEEVKEAGRKRRHEDKLGVFAELIAVLKKSKSD